MNQYLTLTMLWGRDANAVYAATHNLPWGAPDLRKEDFPWDFPPAIGTALSLDEAQFPSPLAMTGLAAQQNYSRSYSCTYYGIPE